MLSDHEVGSVRGVILATMEAVVSVLANPSCSGDFRHVMLQALSDLFTLGLAPNGNTARTVQTIAGAVREEINNWNLGRSRPIQVVTSPLTTMEKRLDLN